jgi:hypothetical protein
MQYAEYKTAGKRHIDTCEKLIAFIKSRENEFGRVGNRLREQGNITKNLFYLSGYIIECSVFYKFFTCISPPSNPYTASIYDLNNRNNSGTGITFGANISNHFRFTTRNAWDRTTATIVSEDKGIKSRRILNFIHSQGSSILAGTVLDNLRSGNSRTATGKLYLAQEWDPDTRYQLQFIFTENDCLEYFKEAKLIFNRLT